MKATLLYNHTSVHSMPTVVNLVTAARLRMEVPSARIIAAVWPWPQPELFDKRQYLTMSTMMIVIAVAVMIVVPYFATEIIRDRKVRFSLQ